MPGIRSKEKAAQFLLAGEILSGARILFNKASGHVHAKDVSTMDRNAEHMEVRLDIVTSSPDETRQAGIEVGDFVAFDPTN